MRLLRAPSTRVWAVTGTEARPGCWLYRVGQGEPSGPSTRVTCATSIGASWGWSFATDCAAHSDEHSRSQPQEQVTSHEAFTVTQIRPEQELCDLSKTVSLPGP